MNKKLKYVSVGDINFRVYDEGEGDVIMLLHGFPDSLLMWRNVVPLLLERGFRVIAFDQRGYGETDMPIGKQHYKIDVLVDDIKNLLEGLSVSAPIHILGHDWGAINGWAYALAYPDKIKSMVALSVGHPESYTNAGLDQKLGKGLYVIWFQFKYLTERYLLNGGFQRWGRSHPDLGTVLKDMSRPGRLTAALNWYRANFVGGMLKTWDDCEVPTLGVWSDADEHLTEGQMKNSKKYMKSSWRYHCVEKSGHWIPLEKPETVAHLAIDWFTNHA